MADLLRKYVKARLYDNKRARNLPEDGLNSAHRLLTSIFKAQYNRTKFMEIIKHHEFTALYQPFAVHPHGTRNALYTGAPRVN